jgi:AbrB family looped-hinge helix DNA binding protein
VSEVAIVTVSEKGQIVLPKRMRDLLKIGEGSRLLVEEKNGKMMLMKMDQGAMDSGEIRWMMGVSEKVLKKDWDYKGDDIWDEL